LDYEGLVGRLLSASYAPLRGEPLFDQMITKLSELFNRHQVDGVVAFDYVTEVYSGQLDYRENGSERSTVPYSGSE